MSMNTLGNVMHLVFRNIRWIAIAERLYDEGDEDAEDAATKEEGGSGSRRKSGRSKSSNRVKASYSVCGLCLHQCLYEMAIVECISFFFLVGVHAFISCSSFR